MTRRLGLMGGKRAKMPLSQRLNRLAASPWTLSCTSFLLTALLIRSHSLIVF